MSLTKCETVFFFFQSQTKNPSTGASSFATHKVKLGGDREKLSAQGFPGTFLGALITIGQWLSKDDH